MLALAGRADPLLDRYLGWLVRQVEQADVAIGARQAGHGRAMCARSAPTRSSSLPAPTWGEPDHGRRPRHVRTVPQLRPWLDGGDDHLVGQRVVLVGGEGR